MPVNCGPEMSASARSKMDGAAERNKHGNCRRHTRSAFWCLGVEGCFVVGEVFPLNEIRSWAKVVNELEYRGAE